MAGVAARGQFANPQFEFVAVRADEADRALKFGAAQAFERFAERVGQLVLVRLRIEHRRPLRPLPIPDRRTAFVGGDVGVASGDQRAQRGDESEPARGELDAFSHELVVPDLQAGRLVAARRPGGLEQCGSLLDHAFVVGTDAGVARPAGDQQVVDETAPFGRVALDDRQILRREQHAPQRAKRVSRSGQGCSVESDPVRLAGVELDLDQTVPRRRTDGCPQDRPLRACLDHGGVHGDPVAAEGGDVVGSLDEVGLSGAVRTGERGDARSQRDVSRFVAAEIRQHQPSQVHS